jgi:pimeloyl-ACP methyl ester carboxylesterase
MRAETATQDDERAISTEALAFRKRVKVGDTTMAYVDIGEGDPIVFLHGNPTPSYLWRNVIPRVLPFGRCLAPDYVGMGNSGASPDGAYRLVDHQRYLDAWFDAMGITRNVTLVLHDWGSALGFSWARRHSDRVKALVYMEAIVRPFLSWDEWPEATREFFKALRTPEGEDLILEKNLFIEFLLPLRGLSNEAIEVYRRHYRNPGPHAYADARVVTGPADRRSALGRGSSRGRVCEVALDEPDSEAVHQWRSGGVSDWRAAGILPHVAESTGGHCERRALSA